MKSTGVPVTEGNGETDRSNKIKQYHLKQISKMDMRSSSAREEEYEMDRKSSFGRREDEDQEFQESKSYRKIRFTLVLTPEKLLGMFFIPSNSRG
jgi:hypothetical protein